MQPEDAVNSEPADTLADKKELSNPLETKSVQPADATKVFEPRKSAALHLWPFAISNM